LKEFYFVRGGLYKVNKSELVDLVAEKAGMSKKDSEKAVKAVLESITDGLVKGDKVQLVGFGTFEVRNRKAREGRNPATGEKIKIKALKVPAFKPGKALKEKVK
jgi:DNA-binding protein HU-beta